MDQRDYYQEKKWCDTCNAYVRYLMSVNHSYCVACGTQVRLFSAGDCEQFASDLEKRKWKAS